MSKLWPTFTKEHPCPACNHSDWLCRQGERKFICMRVLSEHPSKDGGFYHEYGNKKPTYIAPKRSAPIQCKNINQIANRLTATQNQIDNLAKQLGVEDWSLVHLHVSRHPQEKAWAIPMRDGDNKIIGIHLRCDDGSKKAITGSRNGLFIPQVNPQKLAFVCEGASNTAALVTMGFYAIGRPSCNSGGEMLKVALKRLGVSRIVIVGDNDSLKSAPDGRTFRPGQDGAKKLKKEIGLPSCIFTTPSPCKDVRELLIKIGAESARNYIKQSVAMKVWTKI